MAWSGWKYEGSIFYYNKEEYGLVGFVLFMVHIWAIEHIETW